jgi:hypothetical protein
VFINPTTGPHPEESDDDNYDDDIKITGLSEKRKK